MDEEDNLWTKARQTVTRFVDQNSQSILLLILFFMIAVQLGFVDLGFGWGQDYDGPDQFKVEYEDDGSDIGATTETPTTSPEPAFRMNASENGSCGLRCFKVEAYIENTGDAAANDIQIEMTVLTGGHTLKQESRLLPSLAPGERYTKSANLSIGPGDFHALQKNNCRIRSEVTIRHSEGITVLNSAREKDCNIL